MGLSDFIGDLIIPPNEEDHEKAYAEGVEDATHTGFVEDATHHIGDMFPNPFADSVHESHEAGYHDYQTGNVDDDD